MANNLDQIFTNATSGMTAQSIRMNTIASNLANAGNIGKSEESTYHKKYPIFSEVKNDIIGLNTHNQPIGGVRVQDIKSTNKPLEKHYEPGNPMANEEGYIFLTDVNPIKEM